MEKIVSSNARLVEELNLVIQADHEAMEMVQNAYKTKLMIEGKTEEERKIILQEAEEMRKELQVQVAREQALELEKRQETARAQYADKHKAIQEEMQANKEAWVGEIYESVLRPPQV